MHEHFSKNHLKQSRLPYLRISALADVHALHKSKLNNNFFSGYSLLSIFLIYLIRYIWAFSYAV